jgi:CBS domain-containing membrane protein
MTFHEFIRSFKPIPTPVHFSEKLRSGLTGGIAIIWLGLALHALPVHGYPLMMLGSMAASAVLLFAAPHSPFSQPWNLVGGHLVSALAGWLCVLFISDPIIAAGVAVGSAIFVMHLTHCLHPPGAATALTLVLSASQFHLMGWRWVALVVSANVLISLLLALLFNNLLPGRRYPLQVLPPAPPKPEHDVIPEQADIEWALQQMDSVVDVSATDIMIIYDKAQTRAQARLEQRLGGK